MTNEEYMVYIKSLSRLAQLGVGIQMGRWDIFYIDGFYKSGHVTVRLSERKICARYQTEYQFDDWRPLEEQLLSINLEWYEDGKDRFAGWAEIDENWQRVKTELGK